MAVVDVINLDGKTVGQVELADDVFAARVNPHVLHETVRHYLASNARERTRRKTRAKSAARDANYGGRRAQAARALARFARRCGATAERFMDPCRANMRYRFRAKWCLGALRSALSAKFADNKLFVVEDWKLDSHKTKPFRQALTRLDEASRSLLLVEAVENVNLERASRNIEGVKLVPHGDSAVRLAPP